MLFVITHLFSHETPVDCSFILNMNVDQFFPVTSRSQQERIFDIGILWAVPTHRRSVERRLTRKMAIEKRLKPKRNLVMCSSCGHYHEGHTICGKSTI